MFIQYFMYVGGGTDTYSCLDFTVCHMIILHDNFFHSINIFLAQQLTLEDRRKVCQVAKLDHMIKLAIPAFQSGKRDGGAPSPNMEINSLMYACLVDPR